MRYNSSSDVAKYCEGHILKHISPVREKSPNGSETAYCKSPGGCSTRKTIERAVLKSPPNLLFQAGSMCVLYSSAIGD